jgi:hypothetical protein
VRQRLNVFQKAGWHPGLSWLQVAFGIRREQFRPHCLLAAQRMRDPAVPDTGEQET